MNEPDGPTGPVPPEERADWNDSPVPDTSSPAASVPPLVRRRRFDPKRRDRIIDALLEIVAHRGVAGTSFRTVAAQANVPLGSMTYHFCSMQELLAAGFERFVEQSLARLEGRLQSTREPHEAIGALLTLVHEDATSDPPKHLAVSRELQALCVREPAFRTVAKTWFEGSARILQRHFDPLTAQVLPPLLDGLAFFWDYMVEGDTPASDIVAKLLPAPLPRGTCAPANDISPGW